MTVSMNQTKKLNPSSPSLWDKLIINASGVFVSGFRLLDQMMLSQLANYFVLVIIALTVTLLFSDTLMDLLFDLQNYGMPLHIELILVFLQIPKLIALAIPMACVLATLLSYSAMNQSQELIPIRMAGISLYRLALPVMILAVFSAIFSFWLNESVVPQCVTYTKKLKAAAMAEYTVPISQKNFTFKQLDDNGQLQRMIYISSVEHRQLKGVIAVDLTHPGTLQVTQARRGNWTGENIRLEDASVYTLTYTGNLQNLSTNKLLYLENFFKRPRFSLEVKPQDSSINYLLARTAYLKRLGEAIPENFPMLIWSKLFFPLTVIPLALLCVPLSITAPRKGNQIGFVIAITVTFLYYVLLHAIGQLGDSALLPPFIAALLPTVVLGLVCAGLYHRKNLRLA